MPGKWPPVEGRYKLGSEDSPVAICTMASIDLVDQIPREGVAVIGKCVTENLGVEKIVENITANPKIRFLILCGKVSKGHFVGQAIKCLVENGIDQEGRIMGAKGAMPVLKNVSRERIEQFRRQVEPIDLEGVEDIPRITMAVQECISRNPGPLGGGEAALHSQKPPQAETIEAPEYDEEDGFQPDPMGFFTIMVSDGSILVEHYSSQRRLLRKIRGKAAKDIYKKISDLGIVSRHDHAAYLGKELLKAELALRNNLRYEQDRDLTLSPGSPPPKGGGCERR